MNSLLLLVNPVSGRGDNLLNAQKIKGILAGTWHIQQHISTHKGHFTDLLRGLDLSGVSAIGVVGGDGTMHEVLNGLLDNPRYETTPVVLFPCGTGNALNHDWACLDIETACRNLQAGRTRAIDIMQLSTPTQTLHAFNVVGWGLVSDINHLAEKMRFWGAWRYTLSALMGIFRNPHYEGKVWVDGRVFEGDFCFVLISNTIHTGKAMQMSPLAQVDDGLLDVIVVKHLPIWQLLRLFPLIFSGKHIKSDLLTYLQAQQISIEAPAQPLNIDGEMSAPCPVVVKILPQKFYMIG